MLIETGKLAAPNMPLAGLVTVTVQAPAEFAVSLFPALKEQAPVAVSVNAFTPLPPDAAGNVIEPGKPKLGMASVSGACATAGIDTEAVLLTVPKTTLPDRLSLTTQLCPASSGVMLLPVTVQTVGVLVS